MVVDTKVQGDCNEKEKRRFSGVKVMVLVEQSKLVSKKG